MGLLGLGDAEVCEARVPAGRATRTEATLSYWIDAGAGRRKGARGPCTRLAAQMHGSIVHVGLGGCRPDYYYYYYTLLVCPC